MNNLINVIVAEMDSADLRRVRDALDDEICSDIAAGVRGTAMHVGKFEMMQACGAELLRRHKESERRQPVDICHEDGIRYAIAVRVF